jgi:hypothetical protein
MHADQFVAEAIRETGLEDFGTDSFREGLEVYCESASTEARLNQIGEIAVGANITANLVNRLGVVDWVVRHPAVAAERIERPLFVIGMFRAGTTLLSNLLDQDRSNRALLRWEAGDSTPPVDPTSLRAGPRVDAAQLNGEMLEQLNPKISVVHHEEANGPTECITVMSQDFKSLAWEAITNVPTYGQWLYGADQRSAYEYHRTVLQILQSGGSRGRWTLKSPHHAIALDDLTAVYPDARLVLLHRDPVVLCASVCSLIQTLSSTFSDADHSEYIARHWTEMLETSVVRTEAFRVDHPEHPILDVHYADLVRSPVETVAGIYRAFGDDLSEEAAANITEYVSLHRKGHFGEHRYDLAEFGLDEAELAERFAPYVSRYEIPDEG